MRTQHYSISKSVELTAIAVLFVAFSLMWIDFVFGGVYDHFSVAAIVKSYILYGVCVFGVDLYLVNAAAVKEYVIESIMIV